MDPFGTGQTLPPLQLPQTAAPTATSVPLKKPPKWIRRPVGASFAVSPVYYFISPLLTIQPFHLLLLSETPQCNWPFLFSSVWREAGVFGKHKAKPSAASAAQLARRPYQSGCYRNGVLEALRAAAGHPECWQLCGLLSGKN